VNATHRALVHLERMTATLKRNHESDNGLCASGCRELGGEPERYPCRIREYQTRMRRVRRRD
jgi:hypothetical protein